MMKFMKFVGIALAALLVVTLARTCAMPSLQVRVEPVEPARVDVAAAADRLAAALRLETISHEDPRHLDPGAFLAFHALMERSFPRVHATLERETVNDLTLLYRWPGADPSLRPIVLMSHIDVVPVAPGTEDRWLQPPFGGVIADGFIWGRGALDDKFGVVGILEAIEILLGEGFEPARTTYLVFGHDEEVGGDHGALAAAQLLHERGVEPEYVLDEGGAVIVGVVPGLDVPVAAVGIAEKGSVTLELVVEAEGGHSSTPPPHTAIGVLSQAVVQLERQQMPRGLKGASLRFFEFAGPEMPLPLRFAFANLWLTGCLIERVLESSPASNATLRTTTAVTMIEGGVKQNVLPAEARATVNFRILPGETSEDVVAHAKRVIADPAVQITVSDGAREPTSESPVDGEAFRILQRSIGETFAGAVVAPYLTLGGTDSRHFAPLTPNIYKFAPIIGRSETLALMHGTNERIGVEDYANAIRFYVQLLRNSQPGAL